MLHLTRRTALIALAPAFLSKPLPGLAAVPAALPGAYALPDGLAKVAATLSLPARTGSPPGTLVLDVAMTRLGAHHPITHYDVELTKQLHLIAVSSNLQRFLHEHGERPGPGGHFRVPMRVPYGGRWHVYADAVPTGLGQQVMRFDVDLDGHGLPPAPPEARTAPQPTGLDGSDGRYGIRFDALDLRAGQEAQLALHVLRDGSPAPDVTPYLGVAAHAVFIGVSDLSYIHAHAAPAAAPAAGGTGTPMRHDMTGAAALHGMGHADGDEHRSMPGMGGAPLRSGAKVSPDLTLHVRVPKAGTYLLWLQFVAGGQVRTVPFVVAAA